jgi:hypothetical protein
MHQRLTTHRVRRNVGPQVEPCASDPLETVLRAAIEQTTDPSVKQWLRALLVRGHGGVRELAAMGYRPEDCWRAGVTELAGHGGRRCWSRREVLDRLEGGAE